MLRVFILCAERLQTPDDDISDAYCSVTYEGTGGLFRGPEGKKNSWEVVIWKWPLIIFHGVGQRKKSLQEKETDLEEEGERGDEDVSNMKS